MDISLELVAALPLVAYVLWRLVCWLLTPVPLAGIPHNGVKVLGDFREFTGVIKAGPMLSQAVEANPRSQTTGTLLTYFDTMRRRRTFVGLFMGFPLLMRAQMDPSAKS